MSRMDRHGEVTVRRYVKLNQDRKQACTMANSHLPIIAHAIYS
jgi:hypothetical protein